MSEAISVVTGILIPVCAIMLWWGILRARSSARPHAWPSLRDLIVLVVLGLNVAIAITFAFILEGETVILELAVFGWAFTALAAWLTWRRFREKGPKQEQDMAKAPGPGGVRRRYAPLLQTIVSVLAMVALAFLLLALIRGGLEPVVYIPLIAAHIVGIPLGIWGVLSFVRRRRSPGQRTADS
jgi:hypothetical protein